MEGDIVVKRSSNSLAGRCLPSLPSPSSSVSFRIAATEQLTMRVSDLINMCHDTLGWGRSAKASPTSFRFFLSVAPCLPPFLVATPPTAAACDVLIRDWLAPYSSAAGLVPPARHHLPSTLTLLVVEVSDGCCAADRALEPPLSASTPSSASVTVGVSGCSGGGKALGGRQGVAAASYCEDEAMCGIADGFDFDDDAMTTTSLYRYGPQTTIGASSVRTTASEGLGRERRRRRRRNNNNNNNAADSFYASDSDDSDADECSSTTSRGSTAYDHDAHEGDDWRLLDQLLQEESERLDGGGGTTTTDFGSQLPRRLLRVPTAQTVPVTREALERLGLGHLELYRGGGYQQQRQH